MHTGRFATGARNTTRRRCQVDISTVRCGAVYTRLESHSALAVSTYADFAATTWHPQMLLQNNAISQYTGCHVKQAATQ